MAEHSPINNVLERFVVQYRILNFLLLLSVRKQRLQRFLIDVREKGDLLYNAVLEVQKRLFAA